MGQHVPYIKIATALSSNCAFQLFYITRNLVTTYMYKCRYFHSALRFILVLDNKIYTLIGSVVVITTAAACVILSDGSNKVDQEREHGLVEVISNCIKYF